MKNVATETTNLARIVDNVSEIAQVSSDTTTPVAATAEQQLASMEEVASAAVQLGALVRNLSDKINALKVQ